MPTNRFHRLNVLVPMLAVLTIAAMIPAAAVADEPAKPEAKDVAKDDAKATKSEALMNPALADETAPDVYLVKVATTAGDFVIEVNREWAPHGADRFYNLVKIGYYNDTAFYRVIDDFMAQVGFHGDPKVNAAWRNATIPDDDIKRKNTKGMVTFAMTGRPNSRTTQFFINYKDNSYLRMHGKFAPFGKVVEGMNRVDELYSDYGEGAPQGKGPSQAQIARQGNAYLQKEFPNLDYIISATIVEK